MGFNIVHESFYIKRIDVEFCLFRSRFNDLYWVCGFLWLPVVLITICLNRFLNVLRKKVTLLCEKLYSQKFCAELILICGVAANLTMVHYSKHCMQQ